MMTYPILKLAVNSRMWKMTYFKPRRPLGNSIFSQIVGDEYSLDHEANILIRRRRVPEFSLPDCQV